MYRLSETNISIDLIVDKWRPLKVFNTVFLRGSKKGSAYIIFFINLRI